MRRFQPALIGGVFIGVLSWLPIVSAANVCCCLWVVTGGFITVYLQRQRPVLPGTTPATEAVLGGLVAGFIGGALQSLLSFALFSAAGGLSPAEVQDALNRLQLPDELRQRVVTMMSAPGFLAMAALVTLPVYAVFSMIGALLGMAVFKAPAPPTAPPPPPVS
jgi:hypothetical protein